MPSLCRDRRHEAVPPLAIKPISLRRHRLQSRCSRCNHTRIGTFTAAFVEGKGTRGATYRLLTRVKKRPYQIPSG